MHPDQPAHQPAHLHAQQHANAATHQAARHHAQQPTLPQGRPQRTVLILGAQGRFGAAAADAFWSAGWRVIAQARRGALQTPLHDTEALAQAAAGASVVVYAVNPPYTAWDTQMLPLARAGMAVAERLGALFVLPGNVYAYGEHMPALLSEATPAAPTTPKGRLRQQLEDELAERAARTGLRSLVLRAGDFYGQGTGSWIDLLVAKRLAQGKLVYPGALDVPHAWAYLPDVAAACVALCERALHTPLDATGHARVHFAGHTLSGQELLDGIEQAARTLGVQAASTGRLRRSRMRWAPLRVAGLVVPMLRELARMAYLWRVPHALDGTRLQQLVGSLPATPLHEALQQTLLALGHGQARTATSPGGSTPPAAARARGPALSSAP